MKPIVAGIAKSLIATLIFFTVFEIELAVCVSFFVSFVSFVFTQR